MSALISENQCESTGIAHCESNIFKMPGTNCSIFGCNSNQKNTKIGIMKVPSGDDEYNNKWRKELKNIVTKDRVIDAGLRTQIEKCTIRICEKHFHPSQLNYREYILYLYFILLDIYLNTIHGPNICRQIWIVGEKT